MIGDFSVVFSEIILSLYPILIKIVPTNFDTQLLSRFGVFTLAPLLFYSSQQFNIIKLFLYGAITLFHVVVSYAAFSSLSAGTAMALFYTYPIMNVIAGVLFLNESVSTSAILFLTLGFIGTIILSQEIPTEEVKGEKPIDIPRNFAIAAGLLAAFSETLMFLVVRETKSKNPIDSMLQLYPGAFILFSLYLFLTKRIETIDTNKRVWRDLTLFNLFVGFIGYSIRFYSINTVSTITFSLLSFAGVLSSYFFGRTFINEKASNKTYLGAALIAASASGISFLQN
uniref:EamA domain-containing protein n=1 Tax=viral metagenome TaxID=1070528 RepID=A0A6C0D9M6_9ZZZZ